MCETMQETSSPRPYQSCQKCNRSFTKSRSVLVADLADTSLAQSSSSATATQAAAAALSASTDGISTRYL